MQAATRSLFLSVKCFRPVWRLSSPISCVTLFSTQTRVSSPPKHGPPPHLSSPPKHLPPPPPKHRPPPPICDMNALDNEMSKIVGLDDLKMQLRKWLKGMLLDERRRALGLKVGPRRLPQFAFIGNPGTGKTMVGCMLGRLLHMIGILPTDKVIEVHGADLIGETAYLTMLRTRDKILQADGGILFVDEAYRLVPNSLDYRDVGMEALEEIMSFTDDGRIVVIFAGYTKPMQRAISSSEGIRRWISNIVQFNDISCEHLAEILHLKLSTMDENSPFYGFKLDPRSTGVKDVAALIERGTTAEQRGKMNGGLVDQMLVKAREKLDSRIDVECTDEYPMTTITLKDLADGLQDLADGLQLLLVEEQVTSEWNKKLSHLGGVFKRLFMGEK